MKPSISKRVLIVDDDQDLSMSLKDLLECDNMSCMIANNALHALRILNFHKFDLIISDIEMPFLNGLEFYKKLRQFDKTTEFILTSGNVQKYNDDIRKLNILNVVEKPSSILDFINKKLAA